MSGPAGAPIQPVALVSGAATGIGRATALALGAAGHAVAACDLDGEGLADTVAEIGQNGGRATPLAFDVGDATAVREAVLTVRKLLGTPSAVFASAGVMRVAPFLSLPVEQWETTLRINLTGTFHLLQACAQAMVDDRLPGSMVVVASVAARGPRPDAADYAASKAALVSLVRSAAVALAPHGIRVNAVCPGVVDTEMTRRNAERRAAREGIAPDEALRQLVAHIPLGRAAAPMEIAAVGVRLLSGEFGYVTGQALNVCGGLEFD